MGERFAVLCADRTYSARPGAQRKDSDAAGTAAGSLLRSHQSAMRLAPSAGSRVHRYRRFEPPPASSRITRILKNL